MSRFYLREMIFGDDEDGQSASRIHVFRDLQDPFSGLSDQEIYRRYRFTKEIIVELTDMLKDDLAYPTNKSRALPPLYQVIAGLRYLATNSFQVVVGDTIGINQSTACRAVHRFMKALVKRINQFIRFPTVADVDEIKANFYDMAGFPNVVGCIDGTHVRIIAPASNQQVFRNRKGFTSVNVQCICDDRGAFVHVYANWPGSAHDARVYRASNVPALTDGLIGDNWLLGDSGYPCTPTLLTPFRNPTCRRQKKFNKAHRKTRVLIEQVFGRWKRRFSILLNRMRLKSPRSCCLAITCSAILHNLAVSRQLPDIDDVEFRDTQPPAEHLHVPVHGEQWQDLIAVRYFE